MRLKFSILFVFFSCVNILAQKEAEAKKIFDIYEYKNIEFSKKRQVDSTRIYLMKMDSLLNIIKDSSYFYRTELIKGTFYTAKSEYDKSMQKLLKATSFFKRQKDNKNYFIGKYRIGVCYYYVNRRIEAQKIMTEVIANSHYVSEQMKINALSNLGAIDIELGMVNKNDSLILHSIKNLRKAIKLNLKNKSYGYVTSNYSLLAEAHNQLDNKEKALMLLDSAVYYAKKGKDISSEGFALIKQTNILTSKKEFKKALKLINRAINIYQKESHLPTKIYAYLEKKKLLVAMEKYKEANSISDSIYGYSIQNYDKRFIDGIAEMKVKYNTAEKEREILIQRANIAEKGLLIQKKNYQIYGFLGLLLLFSFLGYFLHKQQQLKQKQLIKENELKSALQKVETQSKLQEQRLRISRDLHDNIGAQLSFIISSIDNLKFITKKSNPELKEKLTFISTFTTTTIHQLRDTIWAMNKNEIALSDLQSRILSFIENAKNANNKIRISFEVNVKNDEIVFTSIKGVNIFRVVQEAINNAMKYSNATQIEVQVFELNDDELVLKIIDNGLGFDINKVVLGNGLKNMQDRIDEVGGKLIINSNDKGTIISIACKIGLTNKV